MIMFDNDFRGRILKISAPFLALVFLVFQSSQKNRIRSSLRTRGRYLDEIFTNLKYEDKKYINLC